MMAYTWTEIDKYTVGHVGRKSGADETKALASIICYLNNQLVGYINFYLDGRVPHSSVDTIAPGVQQIRVRFGISRIGEIMDTLRLEKPIYIGYESTFRYGLVETAMEPVGEEEAV